MCDWELMPPRRYCANGTERLESGQDLHNLVMTRASLTRTKMIWIAPSFDSLAVFDCLGDAAIHEFCRGEQC